MSLLTTVFSFLGIGVYNTTPPAVGNAQASPLQIDANGRLLVTVAAITGGAALLALPVATAGLTIGTPTLANGYAVSLPFNTSGGAFSATMPVAPLRGMRVTVMDSGGSASAHPLTLTDGNGHAIQSPFNPALVSSSLAFVWNGFAATWEFVTGDPTNGSFWQVVRSLQ